MIIVGLAQTCPDSFHFEYSLWNQNPQVIKFAATIDTKGWLMTPVRDPYRFIDIQCWSLQCYRVLTHCLMMVHWSSLSVLKQYKLYCDYPSDYKRPALLTTYANIRRSIPDTSVIQPLMNANSWRCLKHSLFINPLVKQRPNFHPLGSRWRCRRANRCSSSTPIPIVQADSDSKDNHKVIVGYHWW